MLDMKKFGRALVVSIVGQVRKRNARERCGKGENQSVLQLFEAHGEERGRKIPESKIQNEGF